MRRCVVAAALAVATLAIGGSADAAPAKPDYAKAYAEAMRCMVFGSFYKDEVGARAAFEAWKKLGELQGFENAKLNVDMDWAIDRETKKFAEDPVYRKQTQVDCRALGWAQ